MTVYNPKPIFLDPRIEYGEAITKTLNAEEAPKFINELNNNAELKIQGNLSRTIFNQIINAIRNSKSYFSLDLSETNGLKRIKQRAFYHSPNIYTIKLPDSIQEIGKEAFSGCELLEGVLL